MFTEQEFADQGLALSREANVLADQHNYFVTHCPRLYQTCRRFELFDRDLGAVLEIGPFYGYTPFILRPRATSYHVLEGDDPAGYPLKPLYAKRQIKADFVDLFEIFGPTHSAAHALSFGENSFDTVLCWETMEHFNFNPVKFVRELKRVLRPGGRAYITVPNKVSFQNLISLVLGRAENHLIDSYFVFEDYISQGKKAFYGFHWREYSAPELRRLFARAGFEVRRCCTFVAFQTPSQPSVVRRLVRSADALACALLPRYGTHVYLEAEKQ
jgi:SAM-dependent methyltransferase